MSIVKKSKANLEDIASKKADAFIEGTGRKPQDREKKVPILIRVDPDILRKVDAAAKSKGVNRTVWILYQIGAALEEG